MYVAITSPRHIPSSYAFCDCSIWIYADTPRPVVQSFSQLICGPIFGALLGTGSEQDRLHNFARAICLGAAMMVVATGFMMMARWKSAGWTLRART